MPEDSNPTQPKEAEAPLDSAPGEPHAPDMPETQQMDAGNRPSTGKKPKNKKKMMMIMMVILLLLIGSAAVWYFLIRKDSTPVVEETAPETTDVVSNNKQPENIAYAFRDGDKVPYTLFTRPAIGGERSQAQILADRNARPIQMDVNGQKVAFAANEDVYVSSDGGASYTMALDSKSSEQITSLKISSDGSKVVVGHLVSAAGKNTVKSIDIASSESSDLFSTEKAGVFILGVNDSTIIYQEGCYNCDGRPEGLFSSGLDGANKTSLLDTPSTSIVSSPKASADLSSIIYVDNSVNKTPSTLGDDVTAPYKITSLNVASKENKVLATVGEAGEKNANGTNLVRSFILGFSSDDQTPWYAQGNQIVALRDSNPVIYETTDDIYEVYFVDSDTIIASTGVFNDFSLGSFNQTTKETAEILKGDGETVIFGVTTN